MDRGIRSEIPGKLKPVFVDWGRKREQSGHLIWRSVS
jgi:hypothetical protein